MATSDAVRDGMQALWDKSFQDQMASGAYNTSPVEAVIRTVSHYLRPRYTQEQHRDLEMMEVGCGAGPNLVWLAEKGIKASGIDISPKALELCRANLERRNLGDRVGDLLHASATDLPFEDNRFDGVLESAVFQHLPLAERKRAFAEVVRVLKPGGVFAGHMLNRKHTTFVARQAETEDPNDPGTVRLDAGDGSKVHLESIGLAHFYAKEEYQDLLAGCSVIEPLELTYELPVEEARRRGYDYYRQAMWVVFAVK
jgi:SAM-dependent methyltransferase